MVPLDARALETFRAIAETGSVTRAADRLATSQPTVTRTLGILEAACGFRLFNRGRHGMTLTPQGAVLFDTVERSFVGLRIVQRKVMELKQGLAGTLWAIALPVISEGMLPTLLGEFMRAYPLVSIDLQTDLPELVLNRILTGEVDFGAIIGQPPVSADIAVTPFGHRTLMIAVAPDHRLARRERVDFRELDGEAFILTPRGHNVRLAVEAMMNTFGVRPSIVHEVWGQRAAAELARRSNGIGFIDSELPEVSPGDAGAHIPIDPPQSWAINLIYPRDRPRSSVFDAFLQWLAARNAAANLSE
jgi:DNA-binding transcriptional LysR family regulator